MKRIFAALALLLTGCSQYGDDDLDTRPVTNNMTDVRPPSGRGF